MDDLAVRILVLVPAATFGRGGTVQLSDAADGRGPQVVSWDTAALGTQPTAQQLAAVTAQQIAAYYTAQQRAAADGLLSDPAGPSKLQRAAVLALVDYLNALEGWISSFTAAVAAATSLSNLQTRVAALSVPPAITAANAKAAVQAKINGGAAD